LSPRLRRCFARLLVLAATHSTLSAPARAEEERAVPLDRDGRLLKIDQVFAQRMGWLPAHPGLREARLLRTSDSTYVLEYSMDRRGELIRERQPLSAAQVDSLRDAVTAVLETTSPHLTVGQEGKPILLGTTALVSIGFWAWAIPVAAGASSEEAFTTSYLIVAGSAVLLPNLLTRNSTVTYGMGDMAMVGATRGIVHGALVYDLAVREGSESRDDQALLTCMVAGSMGELIAGYEWARLSKLDAGAANSIATMSDFGMLCGFGTSHFIEFSGEEDDPQAQAATVLTTSFAGALGGRYLASKRDYTYGDVSVMRNMGFVGAMAGMAIANIDGDTETDPTLIGAITGSAVGLVVGDRLVRHTDVTFGNSVTNTLSTVAGGLVGMGIGALAGNDYNSDRVFWAMSTAGVAAGFFSSYKLIEERSRIASMWPEDLQINVAPMALVAPPSARKGGTPPPAITLSYRF